jgi:hypothetical protein
MSLLDEHYPDATYPTLPDRKGRDAGPRIISLVRTVDVLRAELARLTAAPLPATDPAVTNWTAVEGVLAGREADGNSYVRIADVRAAWVGTGVAT